MRSQATLNTIRRFARNMQIQCVSILVLAFVVTGFLQVIAKHRAALTRYIAYRASDIKYLSAGEVIFVLALHDIENLRSAAGYPSSLVTYFVNGGLNAYAGLSPCMESVAEKV